MFERFLKNEAPKVMTECTPIWEIETGIMSFKVQTMDPKPEKGDHHAVNQANENVEVVPGSTVVSDHDSTQNWTSSSKTTKVNLEELWAADEEVFDPDCPNLDADDSKLKQKRAQFHKTVVELPHIGLLSKLPEDKLTSLSYNIINVIAATAYLYRKHNGDLLEQHSQVSRALLGLAPCLRNDWKQYYSSPQHAFRYDLLTRAVGVNNRVVAEKVASDSSAILKHQFKVCEVLYLAYDCFLRELSSTDSESEPAETVGPSSSSRSAGTSRSRESSAWRQQLSCTLQKLILMITQTRDLSDSRLQALQSSISALATRLSKDEETEGLTELKLPK